MIGVILILLCITGYFHYNVGKPVIYEYSEGLYGIRAYSKYLDIQSFEQFQVRLWKSSKDKLLLERCLTKNINLLKDILNEL